MLTERQRLILAAIIQDYAKTGKAVGSKTLLEELGLAVSSATVRNEMASLEEQGLLQKEHTSSGRVPSQRGYRYYVDKIMRSEHMTQVAQQSLERVFNRNFQQIDDLMQTMVTELANITGYTVVALKPESVDTRLSGFRLVPVDGQQVMAIIVTNDGQVTSQSFRLPEGMDVRGLDDMVRYINQTLVNQPIVDVLRALSGDLPLKMERTIRTPVAFLQLFGDVLARSIRDKVFVGGRLNVLDYTDDTELQEIKQLLQLLDAPSAMRQVMGNANDGVLIQIGDENGNSLLSPYSLISATYRVPQHGVGALAVLGPTAMRYADVVNLVDAYRSTLSTQLLEYYR
ncbi:heat-inducible transcription repressor HrcA [Weissella confusa]|uniref:heat-inducible transcriptional repressor HrcA n=1 Tax=Weissella confusa TaxID=1583 RepID=UPI0021AF21E0|nr:heat-inducible transcriptional repressor HrcA [Weissella confusa]MCT0949285.1 heat-inducible transcription repressor HrcA [Weissella confusa]